MKKLSYASHINIFYYFISKLSRSCNPAYFVKIKKRSLKFLHLLLEYYSFMKGAGKEKKYCFLFILSDTFHSSFAIIDYCICFDRN